MFKVESVVVIDTIKDGVMSRVKSGHIPVLYGDGKQAYRYQALITRTVNEKIQNGKVPFKNHTFDYISITWSRNSLINYKDFPPPAPELDESGLNKTDQNGYLYARLTSNVGVSKKVSVTLDIDRDFNTFNPIDTNKTTDADNDVTFKSDF
ncbi:hypothetical protein FE392_19615 [Xenorhabdus sp. 12]|uniref:Uncharacterized protein n=2 Tax=Xenorhabdus santafensis TaxID=2582833 RepID=A0ABU4SF96_9GAMM|nr:hypothetical protein [Xenorhabdus sp. 12]